MSDRNNAALAYRPDLDGLRGLAIFLVVVYHAFPTVIAGGLVGVDVFFVISGYLITQLVIVALRGQKFRLLEFYRRRARRILPGLLLVLSVCCLIAWLLMLPGELQWFSGSLSWCSLFLANVYFAKTAGYFAPAAELNPLLHVWSLGVEEQFYLAWPLLLLLAERFGITKRLLAIVIAISLAISIWGGWYAPTHYFYYPDSRAWELAIGGLLAVWQLDVHGSRARRPSAHARAIIGLALIVAGAFFWNINIPIPGSWSLLPVCGAALLISAGEDAAVNRRFLAGRAMIFLGKISYPLYLWHWPLFSFTRIVLGKPPQPALAAVECAVAVAAAYATFRWVEAPIRFGRNVQAAVPALLAGVACLAVVGGLMNARWINGRLHGPAIAAWDAAARDWHLPGETRLDERSGFKTTYLPSHGRGKIVFIGDSHMEQYLPRADWLIGNHPEGARSAEFVTRSGCPLLPHLNVYGRGHRCDEFFDFAQAQAFQPDVDTVVFGTFWENYFMGEFSSNRPRPRVYRAAREPHETREPLTISSPGTQVAFAQFEDVVRRLVLSGRRVFIVLSNPTSPLFEPLFPPQLRFSVHAIEKEELGGGPGLDLRTYEAYVAPIMDILREIAARTGARVLDPSSTLCTGLICPALDPDRLPRYLDSNHLRNRTARNDASFIDATVLVRSPTASSVPLEQ